MEQAMPEVIEGYKSVIIICLRARILKTETNGKA